MDLPSCPSCGQSVLDDDAAECPFCGASMSGKPKPKPAASPASSGTATAATPAKPSSAAATSSKQPAAKSQPAKKKPSGDDPFEFERGNVDKSIKLRPRPGQGYRHEVVCPMCETVGYTSRKAAGLNVYCANPDCELPVFKAPALTQEQIDEENAANGPPPKKPLLTPLNIGIGSGVLLVGLWSVWFFGFGTTPPKDDTYVSPPPPGAGPITKKSSSENTVKTKQIAKRDPLEERRKFRAELQTTMLRNVETIESAIVRPTAWQMMIDAHLEQGELKTAAKKLQRLQVDAQGAEFFEVRPLVAIAWAHRKQGDRKEADALLTTAVQKIAAVPQSNRNRNEMVAELAAGLIAVNRVADAETLLKNHEGNTETAHISLLKIRGRLIEGGNVNRAVVLRPFFRTETPTRIAAMVNLAGHREWKAGWDWANGQVEKLTKQELLIAWAELRERLKSAKEAGDKLPDVDMIAEQLPPHLRGILFARTALARHEAGDTNAAGQLLDKARNATKLVTIPAIPKAPDISSVLNLPATDRQEVRDRRMKSAAYGELARIEAVLAAGGESQSFSSLIAAMTILRSSAPPLSAVLKLERETTADTVGTALNLTGDERALKFRLYRSNINTIRKESQRAFQEVVTLLEDFAETQNPGLSKRIWGDILQRTESGTEDWTKTRVAYLLHAATANDPVAKDIEEKMRSKGWGVRTDDAFLIEQWRLTVTGLKADDIEKTAEFFSDRRFARVPATRKELIALRIACQSINRGDLKIAYEFAARLRDPFLKLEAFDLVGQRAADMGKAEELWTIAQKQTFRPEETNALCHGLIIGMKTPAEKPAPKTTASIGP